ncbi:MAG: GH32 C-terminal domain-containing protein [Pirellulaceae bacterium]
MKSTSMSAAFIGLLACAGFAWSSTDAPAATYSLADDFSYAENRAHSTWSYRLDDSAHPRPEFPLLPSADRDANALWGSAFLTSPKMWSDASGYWGIGKNVTGHEQISAPNGTRWAPGEVLFHPKSGDSPSGLVVAWTAPDHMVIDVEYTLALAAAQGNGIGLKIMKRIGGVDTEIVALANIGDRLANELHGIVVAQGDQLFFGFDNSGDPGGDIVRADIVVKGMPLAATQAVPAQPSGGTIAEGSRFTFSAPAAGAKTIQWCKDGHPIAGATSASHQINDVQRADAGAYCVVIDSVASASALLKVEPKEPLSSRVALLTGMPKEPFRSPTPKQTFSQTLAEQERELETNVLMLRFAQSRQKMASDPYRPAYHFVSPENMLNDPNGLCFWQGRWHLFYQAYPADEFPDPQDILKRRQHWGHAVSDDLIHWRDLPYAIYPGVERMCFSGSTVVEKDQVVAFYPGIGAGQMVAISNDPLLLNWTKLGDRPVNAPRGGDACIWKEGDTYFALATATWLISSKNLVDWTLIGEFLEDNPFPIIAGDAEACPNFVPIGDKHLLLTFSHATGGMYFLGDYDKQRHKFKPYEHGRFNHGTVAPGGVHAPSAAANGKGGVINILNINDGRYTEHWDQLLSLPQRLTLRPDKRLRVEPLEAVAAIRHSHQHVGETILPANEEIVLEAIRGNAMEVAAEIDLREARWVQLNVLRSPNAEEHTSITFYNYDRALAYWYHTPGVICLDGSRSSTLPDAWPRPPERAVLERGGDTLRLRVFVDRSVVEVFVNERLYLATRVYPGRQDSVGVSLRSQGQNAVLKKLDAWQMKPIWPISE